MVFLHGSAPVFTYEKVLHKCFIVWNYQGKFKTRFPLPWDVIQMCMLANICIQLNENLITSSIVVNILYWVGWGFFFYIYCIWHICGFFSFCFNKYALLSSLLLAQNLLGMCDFSLRQLLNSFLLHVSSGSFLLLFPQMFLGRMHNSPAEVKRSALQFLNGVGIGEWERTSLAPHNIYTEATQNWNRSFFFPS